MKTPLIFLAFTVIGGICAFDSCPKDRCEDSCKNRCGQKLDEYYSCQCNPQCERFGDCCHDYHHCLYADPSSNEATHPVDTRGNSCNGRCGKKFNKKDPCHCNTKCDKHKNCCPDYDTLCGGSSKATINDNNDATSSNYKTKKGNDITNEEIKAISEKIYKHDDNKAKDSDIILNKQNMAVATGNQEDLNEERLYKYVNEELFKLPTYKAFIALTNNYVRKTGTDESYTAEEIKEQSHFLKEIMKTKPMKVLYTFFHSKGLYDSQEEFMDDLHKMWFGLYSRSSGEPDSSGFEHVFIGEVKKNKVSGFHSWIHFYMLEKQGLMDYYSYNYDGPWKDYPDVLGQQFHWDGFYKEVGSQFIGSSPEFDFCLYSLCYIARPGKKCRISLGGHDLGIQTYEWTKDTYDNGKTFIATAYPAV